MSQDNLTQALKIVLADSYALYLKTQNYHWNVEGPRFFSLHTLFEQQYTDLAAAIDEIAETIRQLGVKAPGSFKLYSELATITDGNEDANAEDMLAELTADQDKIMRSIQSALDVANDADDNASEDLMTQRLSIHRKAKWMLQASA